MRSAGDEWPRREITGEGVGRLDVQRLEVQADEVGRERGDPRGDLVVRVRCVRRRCVDERDLVATRAQRRREVTEREQRRSHRLGRRRIHQKHARHEPTVYDALAVSATTSLLDDIRKAPDDDEPRLVWADAVGGERGELVVIQCRLARDELPPAERGALMQRSDELLAANGKAWSGYAGVKGARTCLFRRGFVECVEFDAHDLALTRVLQLAPLASSLSVHANQTLDYRDDDPSGGAPDPLTILRGLFSAPALQRMRGLELHALLYEVTGDTEWHFASSSIADQVAELIASTGALAGFRALAIRDELSSRGFHELMGANVLATVERLRFQYGETHRDQMIELFAATPNLRALDDFAALPIGEIADLIPASVVELRALVPLPAFEALAASPVAGTLERLGTQSLGPVPPAALLARFSKLRALDYQGNSDGNHKNGGQPQRDAVAAFAQLSLPALRELRLMGYLSADELLLIADAFGPQLARFEIMQQDDLPIAELRAKVAGYVATPRFASNTDHLLHVGVDTREPWLCEPIKLSR